MTLTPIRQTLITLLSDGQFHSGEQLGEQLGISRAAVGKHMAALKELGLDLFSLTGKGYRLAVPMALYDQTQLQALAPMAPVHCFPVIDSTNQYLLERVNQLQSGESCLAECQTAGRGRRGKPWVSPFGCQLILSMYWRLEQGMAAAMGLSLAVGVAVVQALESLGYPGVELKWPNDLYYQGRKLAGILVEMSGSAGASCNLVIGVGLNLAMPAREGERIDQAWSELRHIQPELVDRNLLAARMLGHLQQAMLTFEQQGLSHFVDDWNRLDHFAGRPVRLLMGEQEIRGIARGIDDRGALRLETSEGIKFYLGGEISLRRGD
ncbi:TPA: bifunctional biotin--[acetyl-CoA-carboxylase] ligase/biotin operon repressor BirA [Aeromonas salmonicida]|uniref:Bifunctional ligase/repressor BirA n=2 Tax=Aeromonas salmonicida subsp. salmonicida TaxID=29491 RepID=A4SHU0_AERS4|nr:bifunctional biotin--[acetyl-CoA-carboxylase] ligase/biotin operon repressor BirA [Aeromonas salmonicida]ABO88462.1 biotin-(acetyl-CoA-carboxylase) ligase [Aeromonas salmonicida subsp. salmonicida A449]ASI21820.1 biotin--[acetyl-CoA-carboxylase] ligase [Aeromonas salmonicida]ASI26137.1 biotin--[acetyl-CoA-carboxylase] ligase [Aeromonas salmonicida]ASI30255.1 biotin--[acetyl-CoA-carboxylase] ligase [Aeromonas salmonicida]ATD37023.1 biotin--[acetyl-CoA-carboxylase] ligase [Aeromonas salmonici